MPQAALLLRAADDILGTSIDQMVLSRSHVSIVLRRFEADLEPPSAASFAARLILTGDVPWPTDELAAFAAARAEQL
ncbi:MAG: hypothetical protein LC700_02600, partial [Actinobacteria bacterium]|nr:hypothetical protein [Actinomycetota bacterium]